MIGLNHLIIQLLFIIEEYLGLPDKLIHKVPSDGLQSKTDEGAFGFTYNQLDNFITGKEVEPEVEKSIVKMYVRAVNKSRMSEYFRNLEE